MRLDGRSNLELVGDALDNVRDLIRYEVSLAKVEISQEMKKAAQSVISAAAGGVILFFGVCFLLVTGFLALALVVPYWLSALIFGAILTIVGAVLLSAGIRKAKSINLRPEDAIQRVKEDVGVVKERAARG